MAGLEAFEKADITAPRVIENGEINGDAYLLLSYLEEAVKEVKRSANLANASIINKKVVGFELQHEGGCLEFW